MNRVRNATNETARLAMFRRGLGTANFGLNIELRNWAVELTLIYGEKERENHTVAESNTSQTGSIYMKSTHSSLS